MRLGSKISLAVLALLCACANDSKLTERRAAFKAAREARANAPPPLSPDLAAEPIAIGTPRDRAARRALGREEYLCREPGRGKADVWYRCMGSCPCATDAGIYIFREGVVSRVVERSFRSGDGFQAARWGMTQAEVRDAYPATRASGPAILDLPTEVAGYPALVQFYFARDRLTGVDVTFEPVGRLRSKDEGLTILRRLLTEKYGNGLLDNSGGWLWRTPKTTIYLRLAQPALKELLIQYESVELEDLLGTVSTDALKDL